MNGVSHNCHGVREPAADKLDNREDKIEPERPADALPVADMMMPVVVSVMMIVGMQKWLRRFY